MITPEFAQNCPNLYRAVYGKRYLLPHYRQDHYPSQDELNERIEFDLTAMTLGVLGTVKDDVLNAQFSNYCGALTYGRPVMYLERELGEGLITSPLPVEMKTEDVQWPWPQLRVVLPKGLLAIERDGQQRSMDCLDIAMVDPDGWCLPRAYGAELDAWAAKRHVPRQIPISNYRVYIRDKAEPYLCVATQTSYSESGIGPTTYAYTAPWNNHKLGELVGYKDGMTALLKCDEADDQLLARMKQLALNCLLYVSQKPFEYKPKTRRPMRMEGKHMKPALQDAHFVGQELYKAVLLKQAVKALPGEPTGRKVAQHFVKGHWTRQPYGPRQSLRRWQWIGFYWTKGDNEP